MVKNDFFIFIYKNKKSFMWFDSKEIMNILKISKQSLYYRRTNNLIEFKKINNKYFYRLNDDEYSVKRMNIVYCRVSNTKQKNDLDKQEKIIKEYAISNGFIIDKSYKEIASGMNENRNYFNEIINLVIENKVNKIFISFKDRLTRFGFNYFENIFKKFNTEIVVLNLTKEEDFQNELLNDFISIIHHFSMKMYSNRRKNLNDLKKKLKNK
jgi:putative resolvase